jgi:hypothetical protein
MIIKGKEIQNHQLNLKKQDNNRKKINSTNTYNSENTNKSIIWYKIDNKSYELGRNIVKNEKIIKEILNKASKIEKSTNIYNTNSKLVKHRIPPPEGKKIEFEPSHSRQKSLDLKYETNNVDKSIKWKIS